MRDHNQVVILYSTTMAGTFKREEFMKFKKFLAAGGKKNVIKYVLFKSKTLKRC